MQHIQFTNWIRCGSKKFSSETICLTYYYRLTYWILSHYRNYCIVNSCKFSATIFRVPPVISSLSDGSPMCRVENIPNSSSHQPLPIVNSVYPELEHKLDSIHSALLVFRSQKYSLHFLHVFQLFDSLCRSWRLNICQDENQRASENCEHRLVASSIEQFVFGCRHSCTTNWYVAEFKLNIGVVRNRFKRSRLWLSIEGIAEQSI